MRLAFEVDTEKNSEVMEDISLAKKKSASHESWIFPAGVSFALKQNMYWDGFCAFLPDISGLRGGGRGCFSFGGTVQYIEESNIYLCFVVCRLKRGLVT